eukprot:scaffold7709_cov32-Tisochrysis_lutea.AAC.4
MRIPRRAYLYSTKREDGGGASLAPMRPPHVARWTLLSAAMMSSPQPTGRGRAAVILTARSGTDAPTVGAAIEGAASASELLAAGSRIPSPHPPFAAPYLADDAHQRRRQRLACNCLQRLAGLLVGSGNAAERRRVLSGDNLETLVHITSCVAVPSCARQDGEDPMMDIASAREIAGSLAALASLCGETESERQANGSNRGSDFVVHLQPLRREALALATRADILESSMDLTQACSCHWSVRRLFGVEFEVPRLAARVQHLPFDFLFNTVALPAISSREFVGSDNAHHHGFADPVGNCFEQPHALHGANLCLQSLVEEVPFRREDLLTRDGRRWVAIALLLRLPGVD